MKLELNVYADVSLSQNSREFVVGHNKTVMPYYINEI